MPSSKRTRRPFRPTAKPKLPKAPQPASAPAPALSGPPIVQLVREQLRRLASGHQVLRLGNLLTQPGTPLSLSLEPFPAGLSLTMLLQPVLSLVGSLSGPVTGVLSAALAPTQILGSIGTGLNLLNSALTLQSVTGTLTSGGASGANPLLSEVTSTIDQGLKSSLPLNVPLSLPVQVAVSWKVERQKEVVNGEITTEPAGDDLVQVLEGATASLFSLVFLPRFVPLTKALSIPPPDTFWIQATIRLTVDPNALPLLAGLLTEALGNEPISEEISLPAIPVIVPVLPLPTLLVLFRHKQLAKMRGDEEGFALIIVPVDSPIEAIDQVVETVGPILSVLQSALLLPLADTVLGRLRGLLRGLGAVTGIALAQPHVRLLIVGASPHLEKDLKKCVMIKESRFGVDALNRDIRAGRRVSALLLVGPEDTKATLYNAENMVGDARVDKGKLVVTVGEQNFVFIRDLERDLPITDPPGRASVPVTPGRGNTFHNDIESFELFQPTPES